MPTRSGRRERGAAAVEMALVLPLLLLFIGGIVDFGRAFFTQVVLTNAAREGARAAIVQVTDAAVETRALTAATGVNGVTVDVEFNCLGTAPDAVVNVTAPMDWFFLDAFGVAVPTSLTRTAVMGCS